MKAATRVVVLFGLICCVQLVAVAQDVHTDFDRRISLSKYRTYSWAKVDMPDSAWSDRTVSAVDKALSAKGWSCVPGGGDVTIVAVGISQTQTELSTFYSGMQGWAWYGWGTSMGMVIPIQYRSGTLVVDIFDSHNKQLIWRGIATDTLHDEPDKNVGKLQDAVRKMFKKFPPEGNRKKK